MRGLRDMNKSLNTVTGVASVDSISPHGETADLCKRTKKVGMSSVCRQTKARSGTDPLCLQSFAGQTQNGEETTTRVLVAGSLGHGTPRSRC